MLSSALHKKLGLPLTAPNIAPLELALNSIGWLQDTSLIRAVLSTIHPVFSSQSTHNFIPSVASCAQNSLFASTFTPFSVHANSSVYLSYASLLCAVNRTEMLKWPNASKRDCALFFWRFSVIKISGVSWWKDD